MITVATKKTLGRYEARTQILPIEISGLLTQPDRNIQIPFLVWDVSENGIGLWTSRELNAGTSVIVTIGHPYLLVAECRVVWCAREEDWEQGFRMGLQLVEQQHAFRSLIDRFAEQSELNNKHSSSTFPLVKLGGVPPG